MLKSSAAALCCSAGAVPPLSSPRSPARPLRPRRGTARHASTSGAPDSDRPPAWPPSPHPDPYAVLGLPRAAPYCKRRFYQLVKLYHPDAHARDRDARPGASAPLPPATRLERYRLVVAAHSLLSDPERRRLYDAHSLGWTSAHRAADRAWRQRPDSPAHNATWEDWERWHRSRDGCRRPEPAYMSNGSFAALVVLMCMAGALTQVNRAEAASAARFARSTKQCHEAIGQDMLRTNASSAGLSKRERVNGFLRDREGAASVYAPRARSSAPREPARPA